MIGCPRVSPIENIAEDSWLKRKYIYKVQAENELKPTAQDKWGEELRTQDIKWTKYYALPKKSTEDVRIRTFQFEILHRFLPTNYQLKEMKMIRNDSSTFCKLNIEKLEHLFLDCPQAQAVSLDIESFLAACCN